MEQGSQVLDDVVLAADLAAGAEYDANAQA